MSPEPATPAESFDDPMVGNELLRTIDARFAESGAAEFGVSSEQFRAIVAAAIVRCSADAGEAGQREILDTLHIKELVLARACAAGCDAAWAVFMAQFRTSLYATAIRLTRDEAAGREMADELSAELFGMSTSNGRRTSKLDYYMGRGSLEGWLRTVLARRHIDVCRSRMREVSLEAQVESGTVFAARPQPEVAAMDDPMLVAIVQSLAELDDEERFLLVSYFLDERTLANIARQLGVHESTVSRKLDRLTGTLRKRVRKRLLSAGIGLWRCNQMLEDFDVRQIDLDVEATLRQERRAKSI
jgi:RNA polymerase sigma-70 factor (ECF subfamily)